MRCTPCQQEMPDDAEGIFGMDRGDGVLVFGFTCCHKPVGDVAVILGSTTCLRNWLREHPEYVDAVENLLILHGKQHL